MVYINYQPVIKLVLLHGLPLKVTEPIAASNEDALYRLLRLLRSLKHLEQFLACRRTFKFIRCMLFWGNFHKYYMRIIPAHLK